MQERATVSEPVSGRVDPSNDNGQLTDHENGVRDSLSGEREGSSSEKDEVDSSEEELCENQLYLASYE